MQKATEKKAAQNTDSKRIRVSFSDTVSARVVNGEVRIRRLLRTDARRGRWVEDVIDEEDSPA